jgi:hypothetical protein
MCFQQQSNVVLIYSNGLTVWQHGKCNVWSVDHKNDKVRAGKHQRVSLCIKCELGLTKHVGISKKLKAASNIAIPELAIRWHRFGQVLERGLKYHHS